MNHSKSITGRPKLRNADTHTVAVDQAHADGLAAWAATNGFVNPDGSPMIHSAAQRRLVERARERAQKSVS